MQSAGQPVVLDVDPARPVRSSVTTTRPPACKERQRRTAADLRWLDRAFDIASAEDAQGLVLVQQADMWDLDGQAPSHLSQYEPIVQSLAEHTEAFGRPCWLSRATRTSTARTTRSSRVRRARATRGVWSYDAWNSYPSYDVSNFHRIVVHGSTVPLEYLSS